MNDLNLQLIPPVKDGQSLTPVRVEILSEENLLGVGIVGRRWSWSSTGLLGDVALTDTLRRQRLVAVVRSWCRDLDVPTQLTLVC